MEGGEALARKISRGLALVSNTTKPGATNMNRALKWAAATFSLAAVAKSTAAGDWLSAACALVGGALAFLVAVRWERGEHD